MRTFATALLLVSPGIGDVAVAQGRFADRFLLWPDSQMIAVESPAVGAGQWRFQEMPPGFHVTTSSHGVTLLPRGSFIEQRRIIRATAILFPGLLNEGYGLVLADLDQPGRSLEFLIRPSGEAALLYREAGGADEMMSWFRAGGVHPPDSAGMAENELQLELDGVRATFLVNGVRVIEFELPERPPRVEAGLRIGRGLNAHITSLEVITPLAGGANR